MRLKMITEKDKKQYVNYLVEELVDYYHLKQEVARNAVQSSSAYAMLQKNTETAIWQMHEPFDSTVEEIYNEYKQRQQITMA